MLASQFAHLLESDLAWLEIVANLLPDTIGFDISRGFAIFVLMAIWLWRR